MQLYLLARQSLIVFSYLLMLPLVLFPLPQGIFHFQSLYCLLKAQMRPPVQLKLSHSICGWILRVDDNSEKKIKLNSVPYPHFQALDPELTYPQLMNGAILKGCLFSSFHSFQSFEESTESHFLLFLRVFCFQIKVEENFAQTIFVFLIKK